MTSPGYHLSYCFVCLVVFLLGFTSNASTLMKLLSRWLPTTHVPKPFLCPHSPQTLRSGWHWGQFVSAGLGPDTSCFTQSYQGYWVIPPTVQIGNRLPLLKKLQRHSLPTSLSTNSSPRHTRLSTKQPQPAFPALSHCGLVQIVYPKHTPSPFFPTCLTVSILSWNVPSLPIKLLSITHVHASTSLKISLGHSQTYLCCR